MTSAGQPPQRLPPRRALTDQAFYRASGAPLIEGNSVLLLKDAQENYPAWLDAIRTAKRYIHFESYIIHEDDAGEMFAKALIAKAGTLLLALAILFAFFPRILAYPLTVIFLWIAVTLLYKGYKLYQKRPDSPPRTQS